MSIRTVLEAHLSSSRNVDAVPLPLKDRQPQHFTRTRFHPNTTAAVNLTRDNAALRTHSPDTAGACWCRPAAAAEGTRRAPRQQTALLTLAGSAWMCQAANQTVTLVDLFIRGYASDRGLLSNAMSWGQWRSTYCSQQEKPPHVFHSRAGGPRRTEPFQLRTGGNGTYSRFMSAMHCVHCYEFLRHQFKVF